MNRENVFITGGCGFIGLNLIQFLLEKDIYNITVFDNYSVCNPDNLYSLINDVKHKTNIKAIKGDILDFTLLSESIKNHDAVIHLAAHTRVVESLKKPEFNIKTNTMGTFNVFEAARINGIRKVIFASSNAAVGEQTTPIDENKIPKPISPYGASKLFGEALSSAYYRSYGLSTAALRFANAYGPYSNHKESVVAKFIKEAKAGKALEIYGDGNQTRDFIHSRDIARAIYLILKALSENNKVNGEIFQIAFGKEIRIIDLANLIKKIFKEKYNKDIKITFGRARKGEINKNYSEVTKVYKMLKFKAEIKLSFGLNKLVCIMV